MRYIKLIILLLFVLTLSPAVFAQMPVRNPAWVHIGPPHFEGMEAAYTSATINAYNYYGDYWFEIIPGTVVAAPNPLLDGVVHNDTVAQAPTRGSIIYAGIAALWDELVVGAVNTVLTSDGVDVAWALPTVQTSTLLDGAVHTDSIASAETAGDLVYGTGAGWDDLAIGANDDVLTVVGGAPVWQAPVPTTLWVQMAETPAIVQGADYTGRVGGAYNAAIENVLVKVACRSYNGGAIWSALCNWTPVANFVTFYWIDDGAGNIEVHILNDCQQTILCTISYIDLG